MAQSYLKDRHVLLVEDEPGVSRVIRKMLEPEGARVDLAANGSVARQMLDAHNEAYDILLVDARTPVMDGRELYRYLESQHPELARRVVFITGDVMRHGFGSFLDSSGRPYLAKPFSREELLDTIARALG